MLHALRSAGRFRLLDQLCLSQCRVDDPSRYVLNDSVFAAGKNTIVHLNFGERDVPAWYLLKQQILHRHRKLFWDEEGGIHAKDDISLLR